ncbi:MAG: ABC transporter ATP-binding protein [Spirochaetes bacterium]|jgi:putative ABC transport system ATP-binding protein|nr:ABC transporter ATP-binding protein [Spirochaetota bacterium]
MKLITVENLKKNYVNGEISVPALKDINFTINPSSFISFVGPSGSGKTTLLNILGCLDIPTDGSVVIDEIDISKLNRRERAIFRGERIGFIFQDFNLMPVLTVFENIEYPLMMIQNVPKAERADRVKRLIAEVGMAGQENKYPDQISGGQKQRVAIARALVTSPKIVLADEPTANLDHDTAYRIIKVMKKMRDEFGTSFIFSTHDQKVVGEAEIIYSIEDGLITGVKKSSRRSSKGGKAHAKHN